MRTGRFVLLCFVALTAVASAQSLFDSIRREILLKRGHESWEQDFIDFQRCFFQETAGHPISLEQCGEDMKLVEQHLDTILKQVESLNFTHFISEISESISKDIPAAISDCEEIPKEIEEDLAQFEFLLNATNLSKDVTYVLEHNQIKLLRDIAAISAGASSGDYCKEGKAVGDIMLLLEQADNKRKN